MTGSQILLSLRDARTLAVPYGCAMQFPDSTFAALRIGADSADDAPAGRRLLLIAIVLTISAVSAGWLAGG